MANNIQVNFTPTVLGSAIASNALFNVQYSTNGSSFSVAGKEPNTEDYFDMTIDDASYGLAVGVPRSCYVDFGGGSVIYLKITITTGTCSGLSYTYNFDSLSPTPTPTTTPTPTVTPSSTSEGLTPVSPTPTPSPSGGEIP